jgi:hypothetical protein
MARQLLDKYEDSTVAANATEVWMAPGIPEGLRFHITRFGGAAMNSALIALQKRTSTDPDEWVTIRAVVPRGQAEFHMEREYVGYGTLALRVVRQEKSGSAQPIVFWLEGYKVD